MDKKADRYQTVTKPLPVPAINRDTGAGSWLTCAEDNLDNEPVQRVFSCFGYLLYGDSRWAANNPRLQRELERRREAKEAKTLRIVDRPHVLAKAA